MMSGPHTAQDQEDLAGTIIRGALMAIGFGTVIGSVTVSELSNPLKISAIAGCLVVWLIFHTITIVATRAAQSARMIEALSHRMSVSIEALRLSPNEHRHVDEMLAEAERFEIFERPQPLHQLLGQQSVLYGGAILLTVLMAGIVVAFWRDLAWALYEVRVLVGG